LAQRRCFANTSSTHLSYTSTHDRTRLRTLFFFERTLDFTSVFWKFPSITYSRRRRTAPLITYTLHRVYLPHSLPFTDPLSAECSPWISLPRHLPHVSRSTFCGLSIPICCRSDTAPDYFAPCIHLILNLLKPFDDSHLPGHHFIILTTQ